MTRTLDIVGSVGGLLILSPLLLIAAIAVKGYDRGPVLYRARRVGKNGEIFDVYKFRTMVADAAERGPAITASGDRRITPVGKILRRTKLDELPQLLNVLRGEMALVGPRPEDPRYVDRYSADQRRILEVRPGITSAASLRYLDEESILTGENWEKKYVDEVLPTKIEIDLAYLSRQTAASDLKIVFQTLFSLYR